MKRTVWLAVVTVIAIGLAGCWAPSDSVGWSMEEFLQAWLDGDAAAMSGFFAEQVVIGFKTAPNTPEYEIPDITPVSEEAPSSIILRQETRPGHVAVALFTHPESLAYFGDYPELINHDIEHSLEDYEVFWENGYNTQCFEEGTEGYALMAVNVQGDSRIVRVEFKLQRAQEQLKSKVYVPENEWKVYEVWFIVGGEPIEDDEPEEPKES